MDEERGRGSEDRPGVVAPPPLIYLAGILIAVCLNRFWPMTIFARAGARWTGLVCIAIGAAIIVAGRKALLALGTNINPTKPTTAIVQSGPYRFSRNPLYLGVTFVYLGLTLAANTWWGFILLVPVLLALHFGVVRREERYLELKFGDTYRQYRARVRRYF